MKRVLTAVPKLARAAAAASVLAGACGGCNVFEFAPHIWASGGDVLSEDVGEVRVIHGAELGDRTADALEVSLQPLRHE